MIDKSYDEYYVVCDICGESHDEHFDTWDEAVKAKKDNGWTMKRISAGYWQDICPDCQETK